MMGSIDMVEDGIVYGRMYDGDDVIFFEVPLLDVLDDQRVDLQPGRYCSFVNGHLLIEKAMWTTHEIEQADAEAQKLWDALFGTVTRPHSTSGEQKHAYPVDTYKPPC